MYRLTLGNILAQTAVEKRELSSLDLPSLLKFTTFSLCYTFPLVRTWLWTLERIVKPSKHAALKKVALDQFCFAPVSLAAFLCLMQLVEGNGEFITYTTYLNQFFRSFEIV